MTTGSVRRLGCAVAALCLTLAGCSSPPSDQAQPETPSPSPAVQRDYHRFSPPREIASGTLQGTSLDGSSAYVSDTDPAFPQPGCEGQPQMILFRQPLDGGPRELLRDGDNPIRGNIVRGPNGRVALIDVCEEFFAGLYVARESPEGRISEVRQIELQLTAGTLPAPFSFSWASDGNRLLAAINDPEGPDGGPSRLVSIDPEDGAIANLFTGEGGSGVFQFAQLRGGTYVVSSNREVTFRDGRGRIRAQFPGAGFEVFPDGERVLIYGETLAVAREGSEEAQVVAGPRPGYEVSGASVSPDGEAVVFDRYSLEGTDREIVVATVDDRKTSVLTSEQGHSGGTFSGDGRSIVLNFFVSEPEFSARVMISTLED